MPSPFHPIVTAWLARRFSAVTDAQARAWPLIAAGEDAVITAPTGSCERALADREPDTAQRRFIESAPVLAAVAEGRPGASSRPARAGAVESSAFVAHPPTSTRS